jgi:hypothetical protein
MADRVLVICYQKSQPKAGWSHSVGDEVASAWFSDGVAVYDSQPLGAWLLAVAGTYGAIHTEVTPLEAVKASMLDPKGRRNDWNTPLGDEQWGQPKADGTVCEW